MSLPIGVRIIGDNWFHDGWVSGILGLPRREFMDLDNPIPDTDIDAWEDGYNMGMETPNYVRYIFQEMLARKQLELR